MFARHVFMHLQPNSAGQFLPAHLTRRLFPCCGNWEASRRRTQHGVAGREA